MSDHIQTIIHLLFQVDKAMHEHMRDVDGNSPLSLADTMTLAYIEKVEAASITDMAEHFGIRKSSMSTKIAKLEKRDLIHRDSCKFDKRSQSITITPKAKTLLTNTKSYIADHTTPLFSKLTSAEQQSFISLLEKLTS